MVFGFFLEAFIPYSPEEMPSIFEETTVVDSFCILVRVIVPL